MMTCLAPNRDQLCGSKEGSGHKHIYLNEGKRGHIEGDWRHTGNHQVRQSPPMCNSLGTEPN